MKKTTIKKLKKMYLYMLVVGLTTAITYGFYRALEIFFKTPFPVPWNVLNVLFFAFLPILHFAYAFCFMVAFPLLATIQKCEEKYPEGCGKAATRYILLLILENALGAISSVAIVLVVDPFFMNTDPVPVLWAWELPTVVIFVIFAMNLPRIAGTINVDVQELHVKGYHVHESMFGIAFFFAAILLIFNARVSVVDVIFASFFFVFGGFLFGRDIKDVIAGKYITKVSDDLREKQALQEKQEKKDETSSCKSFDI
nr:hypothetical protein [Candidatus Sigynarchaeota archaeon]